VEETDGASEESEEVMTKSRMWDGNEYRLRAAPAAGKVAVGLDGK